MIHAGRFDRAKPCSDGEEQTFVLEALRRIDAKLVSAGRARLQAARRAYIRVTLQDSDEGAIKMLLADLSSAELAKPWVRALVRDVALTRTVELGRAAYSVLRRRGGEDTREERHTLLRKRPELAPWDNAAGSASLVDAIYDAPENERVQLLTAALKLRHSASLRKVW